MNICILLFVILFFCLLICNSQSLVLVEKTNGLRSEENVGYFAPAVTSSNYEFEDKYSVQQSDDYEDVNDVVELDDETLKKHKTVKKDLSSYDYYQTDADDYYYRSFY